MKKSRLQRYSHLLGQRSPLKNLFLNWKHKLQPTQPKRIPEVDISRLVPDEVTETVLESPNAGLDGNVPPHELRIICKLVKHFRPATIFEIGTFDGRTTVNMAANAPKETRIFTLDLPAAAVNRTALRIKSGDTAFIVKKQSGREFLRQEQEGEMITQLLGDSAAFDYTPYKNRMDFVFVDGSHSYEYVLSDTEVALNLLREGKGIVLWHDYGWREVVHALNELYERHPQLGFLQNISGTSLVYFNNTAA